MLTRDEVFPFLNLDRLANEGIVGINASLFDRGAVHGKNITVDTSIRGLKNLLDFRSGRENESVVPLSTIERAFLKRYQYSGIVEAWPVFARWYNYTNKTPRNEGWFIDDLCYFALSGRPELDKCCKAVIRQALKWIGRTLKRATCDPIGMLGPLQRFYFVFDTLRRIEQAQPSSGKDGKGPTREALRKEHANVQQEYSSQKEEWEARNQKLSEDISVLHEKRLRITAKEDNVQGELAQIRSLLQQPRESSDVGDVGELKKQLEEKEEQLKRLKEADAKVVKKLRLAKKKGQSMEKELSKMPAGLMALHERMLCSVDMRSLPPSQFGDSDDLQIVGIPTMRLQKKKYLDSLHQELSDKTCAFIRSFKQGSRLKLYPPPHRVIGTQFWKWSQMENGVKISDWTYLWDYPSNKGTRGETTCHNRALVTVAIDVPRGDDALQRLCQINMALCILLRPWDGIFLELSAQALLVMPWALDILNTLVEKQLVTVWRT
ncbi:hypothetical protein R1sor_008573 [Riccia sorocarpa]|uniref:Uncharacterized protein n=1 Tax=Riccia sorocarpa TaxID=122646 RepID=A0ABD3HTT8_9MARC